MPHTANSRSQNNQITLPYAANLLELINNYRAYYNLAPLRFDDRLNQLARKHSFDMFHQKRMSHNGFNDRFRRAERRLCVENVGWNYSTPLKQFDAWRHSRGHDENMLNEDVRYVGIAEVGKYVTFFACH
ncbi:MAG: CAP domain-containing protein [Desulfobulbus sp.]